MKPMSAQDALVRLETLCSKAEHSEGEMLKKLRAWAISAEDAAKIISSLKARRFIDDQRFARAYVNDKFKFSRWGRRKIASGLASKRVSGDIISQALGEIDDNESLQALEALLSAKIRLNPELISTYEGRTKLYRFALQRGFLPSEASQTIKTLLHQE